MDLGTILYFLVSSVIITLAPGPDNMYLLATSLASGAKCGVFLTMGLASGIVFHTTLVIIGVAALLQESPILLQIVKYVGAAYLLYIAWQAFHAKGELELTNQTEKKSYGQLYRRGVLMNALNPKVLLFFLAFLPQFVNMQDPQVSWHIGMLGIIFSIQAFCIFSLIALAAGKIHNYVLGLKNFNQIMGILQGIILLIIAGAIVIS